MKLKKIKKLLKKNTIKLNNYLENPEYSNVDFFLLKKIKEDVYVIEAHNFDKKIQKYQLNKERLKTLSLKKNKQHTFIIKKEKEEKKEYIKPERAMKIAFYNELSKNFQEGSIISEYTHTDLSSRADFIVFQNGESIVFELKSEKDNLYKLKDQVKEYKKYANKIVAVIHEKHLNSFKKLNLNDINLIVQKKDYSFQIESFDKTNEVKNNIFNLVWYKEKESLFKYFKEQNKLSLNEKIDLISKKININQLTNLILEERYKKHSDDNRINYLNIFKERKFEPCKKNLKYFYGEIKLDIFVKDRKKKI